VKQRLVVLALLLALVVAACGRSNDNTSDDEGGGTTAPAAPTTNPNAAKGLDDGAFGDLGVVCKPGDAKPVDGQVGIKGTEIHVATFSDKGFSGRPGLTREFHDIATAVTKWCNEHGGVNGYKIVADLRDSALTNYTPLVLQSCNEDFFMVAGGAVFDNTGVNDQLKCGLPNIAGYVVTPEAAAADLTIQPVPNLNQTIPIGDFYWLEDQFPEAVKRVGVLTGNIDTTKVVADKYVEAAESLGWTIVDYEKYSPLGEANWAPFVQALKGKRADGIIWVGEPENLAKFLQAAKNLDYNPSFVRTDANHYDSNLVTVGQNALTIPVYVRNAFWPFIPASIAKQNVATEQYLELLKRYGPSDARKAGLGLQGLSGWMMFFKALGECSDAGTVTRDCVYEKARAMKDWTGGGLHVPTTQGTPPDCFSMALATPKGFEFPKVTGFGSSDVADFFTCNPDKFVTTLKKNYGTGAKCPSGKADPLPSECSA
jgi:hypothetical protein